jgi:hypothetical protein
MSAEHLLELLKLRERNKSPLLVLHSPSLPVTPQAEVEAAEAAGRAIVHVRFVRPDGTVVQG